MRYISSIGFGLLYTYVMFTTSTDSIIAEVDQTEENIESATEVMRDLVEQVNRSEKASNLVARKMDELKEYAVRMQDIVKLISNVADQTGLLSLNASISCKSRGIG